MIALDSILPTLEAHSQSIDRALLDDFSNMLSVLKSSIAAAQEENRNLRIAVVGQMKAGKSSFLNAAFFGRDLLPKADTPMTAALTRIVYAPKARAEVVFYNSEDWAQIEDRAAAYPKRRAEVKAELMEKSKSSPFAKPREPSDAEIESRIDGSLKAALELVHKAREHRLDVAKYLDKTEILENIDGAGALAHALHDYVGSGGRFTAITQSTVLHVDDERLKGLEIIDTPGFNDPVISRGEVTRRYLGQCDVIFLLSSLSQFITAADMSVLREQLSEAGIDAKAVFLIGSQRDVALRQDPNIARTAEKLAERAPPEHRAGAKVAAMMQLLDKKMGDYALDTLDAQINQASDSDEDRKTKVILTAVKQTKPRFISSWSWLTAENFNALSPDDQDQLQKLSRDTGYNFDAESLRVLSNIPSVTQEIVKQHERKAQLLAEKERNLHNGARQGAAARLSQIIAMLNERSEQIESGDISRIESTAKEIEQRLSAGRSQLEQDFSVQVALVTGKFSALKREMQEQSRNQSDVKSQRETTTESYEVSTSKWYKPWSWGDTVTRYRQVVTVYASVQDSIETVNKFAVSNARSLQQAVEDCVDVDSFRRNLSQSAMKLFDTSSANFDAASVLKNINKSLLKLEIPRVSLDRKDYSKGIVKSFGSHRVSESAIDSLRQAQHAAISVVLKDLEAEMDQQVAGIERILRDTGTRFVSEMSRNILADLKSLRDAVANKKQSLEHMTAAKRAVESCVAELIGN